MSAKSGGRCICMERMYMLSFGAEIRVSVWSSGKRVCGVEAGVSYAEISRISKGPKQEASCLEICIGPRIWINGHRICLFVSLEWR